MSFIMAYTPQHVRDNNKSAMIAHFGGDMLIYSTYMVTKNNKIK
jgi:hypothetical protein